MSRKERERMKVFARVERQELTLKEAADLTAVSYASVAGPTGGISRRMIAG